MQSNQKLIKQLNLLPAEIIRQQRQNRVRLLLSCLSLLIVGLLILINVKLQHKAHYIKLEMINMQPLTVQTRNLQNDVGQLKARLNHEQKRQSLLHNQIGIDPVADLANIEAILPAKIHLTRISISRTELCIIGQADRPQDVALLLSELQYILGNDIRLSACHLMDNDAMYHFQIEGMIIRP